MNNLTKEEIFYERYKTEKILHSGRFIKNFLQSFSIIACLYLILSRVTFLALQAEVSIALLLMLGALHIVQHSTHWGYYIGLVLTVLLSCRSMQMGLYRFPEYLGMFSALSCFYLWHCHLEFVYNRFQGYITILVFTAAWCYFSGYSGAIKGPIPTDMILTLSVLVVVQLLWYRHRVRKDYEEIYRKIDLETSESNVKNLINAIPEGITVMNQDLCILMRNSASLRLLQGQSIFELKINQKFTKKKRNTCEKLINYVKEFKESVEINTSFGVFSINNNFLDCTGSKTQWNNQLAIIITFRDVSNIINLQSEVSLTSKTLRILQGVSHELKTPLNKILDDHREIISKTEVVPEPLKEYLRKSYSSSKYLLSLIKDMIDYSHIKFNKLQLSFQWVTVDEIILGCIHTFTNMNKDYKIAYKNKVQDGIILHTDRNRFKQCILNLLGFSLG